MSEDPRRLVAGYATDTLDDAERRKLLRAALDDQSLFDTLAEQEGLRELLQDPVARQELLAVLERQTPLERLRAWFEREATLLDLAGVAAVVLMAIAGYGLLSLRPGPTPHPAAAARPMGASLSPAIVAGLLALDARQAVPAGIEIVSRTDAVFAPGETMKLRVSLRAPARVVVLEAAAGGPPVQAWPGLGQPPALVPRPASGGPAVLTVSVEAPLQPGAHRLRLVVAPHDLDLGALAEPALGAAADRLALVDLPFEVKPT